MIAVIDYGMGNLRSVQKALEYLGFNAVVTEDRETVLSAESVVLPGVGAISDALHRLISSGTDKVIAEVILQNKPFLGICLGMQLLFDKSHEGGLFEGFKIISGEVVRLPSINGLKVPHMGWNDVRPTRDHPLIVPGEAYFLHSYAFTGEHVLATTDHAGPVTAAIGRDTVVGAQFHPEKSQRYGLSFLTRFLEWHP